MPGAKQQPKGGRTERVHTAGQKLVHDEQLLEQGYTKVQRGEILKWRPGLVLEGELMGKRKGQYGILIDVRNGDGAIKTYPAPVVLKNQLEYVEVGSHVAVVCKGFIKTANGQDAWDFDVYTKPGEQNQEEIPF